MLIYAHRRIVVTIEEIRFLLRMHSSHTNVATKKQGLPLLYGKNDKQEPVTIYPSCPGRSNNSQPELGEDRLPRAYGNLD